MKHDLRHKSRLVANPKSLKLSPDKEEVYSGVVGMDIVRLGFTVGALRGLDCAVGDVGNAFLEGRTHERCYIVARPEFGPDLQGKRLIIYKALYGLTTSAARYHEVMAAELRSMDFRPSRVDPELWIRGILQLMGWQT